MSAAYDPSLIARVIELGAEGLSRAEIASSLDVTLQRLALWSAEHPEFHEALERADTEALAWWHRQPRLAVNQGGAFHASVWAKAIAERERKPGQRGASDVKAAPPRRRVIFDIPDNGRRRRSAPPLEEDAETGDG